MAKGRRPHKVAASRPGVGLTAIEVGILLSANRWIRLATNHVAHVASPHASPRVLLTGAFALGTITTLGYAATASFTVLVLSRLLWGLAWSFIRYIGVLEVVAHAPAHAGGRAMGFYNGISRIGSVAGLLGGAALVDAFGYVAAVCLLAAASLVSIALTMRDRSLVTLPPRAHSDAPATPLNQRGIVELLLGFALGIVGPGFVTSTLGVVLQPYTVNGPPLPGITAATMTGALLAIRFLVESAAAPSLGSASDRWGIRRTSISFFLLGGFALLAACTGPDSMLLLTLFLLRMDRPRRIRLRCRRFVARRMGLCGRCAAGARLSALKVQGWRRVWRQATASASRCHSARSCARPCEATHNSTRSSTIR